ncbi:hypothetical protein CPB84DRAFT_1758973, partial [Gymnopilus junonius]
MLSCEYRVKGSRGPADGTAGTWLEEQEYISRKYGQPFKIPAHSFITAHKYILRLEKALHKAEQSSSTGSWRNVGCLAYRMSGFLNMVCTNSIQGFVLSFNVILLPILLQIGQEVCLPVVSCQKLVRKIEAAHAHPNIIIRSKFRGVGLEHIPPFSGIQGE